MTGFELFIVVYLIAVIINLADAQREANEMRQTRCIYVGRGHYRPATNGDVLGRLVWGAILGLIPGINFVLAVVGICLFIGRTKTYERFEKWKEKRL